MLIYCKEKNKVTKIWALPSKGLQSNRGDRSQKRVSQRVQSRGSLCPVVFLCS
jgi:hypothetical protein